MNAEATLEVRDLTAAIPEDGQTYATNVDIKESAKLPGSATGGGATAAKTVHEQLTSEMLLFECQ